MSKFYWLSIALLIFPSVFSVAQVAEIKTASSNHSSGSSGRGDGGYSGSSLMADILFNVVFGEIIQAQQQKLQRRHEIPAMVSLEAMVQSAVQPSGYYIVHPRVRVNWGLFSSDFRFNYLIEENIDGVIHIRTNDWQTLQLNLVTTRDVVFRVGGGIMHEAFGEEHVYAEWTAALQYHPFTSRFGGVAEYRDAEVRREIGGFVQYRIVDQGAMHGYLTAGSVYQKYYSAISVWGVQGGMLFKFY
jgi:hypothetical protein